MASQSAIVHLMGKFRLTIDGVPVPLRNMKSQALLAYLSCCEGGVETRERLAALLWSESDEPQARTSLRQSLRLIRAALREVGLDLIRSDQQSIAISSAAVTVDTELLIEGLRAGRIPESIARQEDLGERVLADLQMVDPVFAEWAASYRTRVHDRAVAALEELLASCPAASREGIRVARSVLSLEPTHEVAVRYLMKAYQSSGDTAAALKVYESIWRLLDEEYGVEPSGPTQALAVEIKMASDNLPALHASAFSEPRPRFDGRERRLVVQVLPFDLTGVSPDDCMVVEGFRYDLLGSLARFRDWVVVDWEVASAEADHRSPHVFAVRAKAMSHHDGLRLLLHIVDMRSGGMVWSETVPMSIGARRDVQSLVMRRVAVAMNVQISAEKLTSVAKLNDVDLSLYEKWLRGQALITRWRAEDDEHAERLFRSILEEDPGFYPAYVGLAQILNARHHMLPGVWRSEGVQKEAQALAERAVSLDPLDARARLCAAWSRAMNGGYDEANLDFSLACELNQNDPWTLVSSSLGFSYCGEVERGVELGRQMLALGLGASPLHWAYHAGVMFMNQQYKACVNAAEKGKDATYYLGAWKASALAHLDELDEAAQEYRRFAELVRARWIAEAKPDDDEIIGWLLHCFPIRDETAQERLRGGLYRAAQHVLDGRQAVDAERG